MNLLQELLAGFAWLAKHGVRRLPMCLPPGAGREVGVRIGAHYGPVVISRLGPSAHQHITATGDTVNVASRLLEIAKQHNATTAISDDCLTAAGKPSTCASFQARRAAVRGRARPVVVWLDDCAPAT